MTEKEREGRRAASKRWRIKHRERRLVDLKKWRTENAEHVKQYNAQYRAANKEKRHALYKAWYAKNRDGMLPKKREYQNQRYKDGHRWYPRTEEQRQKRTARVNEYTKRRRLSDIRFRLLTNLRGKISGIMRGRYRATTKELVGISMDGLKQHLQDQFDEKMTWENYGSYWEVDHIKPCILFDFTDPKQQLECFGYKNLRPLECSLNRRLGQKVRLWKKTNGTSRF